MQTNINRNGNYTNSTDIIIIILLLEFRVWTYVVRSILIDEILTFPTAFTIYEINAFESYFSIQSIFQSIFQLSGGARVLFMILTTRAP